jgi:Uri superfamily endonuclease
VTDLNSACSGPLINLRSRDPGSEAGLYHLVISLPADRIVRIGRLGTYQFPRGYYVYTGSARSGLGSRLGRHLRRSKLLHWHIDYLLREGRLEEAYYRVTTELLECEANEAIGRMPGAREVVRGFGSSDCRCSSHLWHFRSKPLAGGS